jgi:ribulose-5-phosphate 4-epimerase/fuculose-1-phosphate aldolase
LPPIDQNSAMFFRRHIVDDGFAGMALGDEGTRVASLMADPRRIALVMGNHGLMVVGRNVAEAFHRLYYFERAAETYILALQTGQPLRLLPDDVAEKTAREWQAYDGFAEAHLAEMRALLDDEGANYAT